MRNRAIKILLPALALGFVACEKPKETKTPETPAAVVPSAAEAPAPAPAPAKTLSLSPDERAARLGFVKHLPQDTEVVMSFHNGSKAAERVKSSKLWKLVQGQMGMGMGMPPDAPLDDAFDEEDLIIPEAEQDAGTEATTAEPGPTGPAALFGTEFTIALGKTTGDQTANLLTLNRRSSYFQMRNLAKALVNSAKTGDFASLASSLGNSYGEEMVKDLLSDPESGAALFEKMNMPPLYLAFRTSTTGRDPAAQQLASLTENLAMLGEMVEPVEVERNGSTFSGYKIPGTKTAASLESSRKEMEAMLDPGTIDRLFAAIAKKDLVVLTGAIGDYVVFFIGSSADDLVFAPDTGHSLVASDALAFCDAYAAKELAAVIYGRKDSLAVMAASVGGLADSAEGLRDGIAGSDALGDTRDLETLLRMVADREAALRKLTVTEACGNVAYFEDGLKIESFGGTDAGLVDWKAPNRLASLVDSDKVLMFANLSTNAAYDTKARAYIESLVETSYAAAMKISELPVEEGKLAGFKQSAKLFDTKFRPDTVALWDAFIDGFGSGLGSERAWVIDLNGSVPPVPGLPKPLIDEGRFPRATMLAPVTDRTKLAASWQRMNSSLSGLLVKLGEIGGEGIPMQKPISSEKDGNTTWFFSLPFFNDDFLPSVTVGDQWFAASTSKNQALDLINQASAASGTREGCSFSMNFKALETFARQTAELLEKNPDAVGIPASEIKQAARFATALADIDKLTVRARREGGVLRSSVHLKTR